MDDATVIEMGQRGVLTLPKPLRERYNLQPGDALTLLDLGGVFVLRPGRSQIDHLADKVAQELAAQGESLESMLYALREQRERYDAHA